MPGLSGVDAEEVLAAEAGLAPLERSSSVAHRTTLIAIALAVARANANANANANATVAERALLLSRGDAPTLPMADDHLEVLLAGVPPALTLDMSPAQCGPLVNWLIGALHPRHLHMLSAADDTVVHRGGGAQGRVVGGPGWRRIGDLTSLENTVAANPGWTAAIIASRAGPDRGHVLALHSVLNPTSDHALRTGKLVPNTGEPDFARGNYGGWTRRSP